MKTLERSPASTRPGLGGTVALAGLQVLLGLAAIGGGLAMIAEPSGRLLGMDVEWLAGVPLVDDYLIPGWFLLIALGVLPLIWAAGLVTRFPVRALAGAERRLGFHWAWAASVVEGVGVLAWIGLQLTFVDDSHPAQLIVAAIGLLILLVAASPGVRARFRR